MVGYALEAVPASCSAKEICHQRKKTFTSLLKKKLEGPRTIISRDKIKRKWLETTERDLFHQGKTDVKSTVVARRTPLPLMVKHAYGQLNHW